jgi:glycosyltransferase involved in cell wall biosynthesis
MNPLVSIIIPCFNAADCVSEAIESALGQTYRNIEVIVIDDGSTDASLEKIKAFGERIRFETGPNRGGCAARNRGIELAQGEYIQFLDADDLLELKKIENHLPELAGDPRKTTVSEWLESDFETGKTLRHCKWPDEDWRRWLLLQALQTSAPLHLRENLIAVSGFRVGLKCCQEKDLHLRLARNGIEFHQLPFIGYTQRLKPGSVSANSLKTLQIRHELLWRIRETFEPGSAIERTWAPLYSEALAVAGRQLWKCGKKFEALTAFKRARDANFGRVVTQGNFTERLRVRLAAEAASLLSIFGGTNQSDREAASMLRGSDMGQVQT